LLSCGLVTWCNYFYPFMVIFRRILINLNQNVAMCVDRGSSLTVHAALAPYVRRSDG
jgi:hypothetical protein